MCKSSFKLYSKFPTTSNTLVKQILYKSKLPLIFSILPTYFVALIDSLSVEDDEIPIGL